PSGVSLPFSKSPLGQRFFASFFSLPFSFSAAGAVKSEAQAATTARATAQRANMGRSLPCQMKRTPWEGLLLQLLSRLHRELVGQPRRQQFRQLLLRLVLPARRLQRL